MKILKIFAIIILLLFPFGELLRFDIGNNIAWKPLDFVIFLTIATWVILFKKTIKKYLKVKYLLFPIIGLVALLMNLSWLKPNEAVVSFFYLLRWVAYAGLIPVFISFPDKFRKKIQLLLFVDGLIMVIFGFIQYFFYNSLHDLYYLGWDPHMHRIFSTFLDPNFTGGFFVLYLVYVAGMFMMHRKKPLFKQHKKKITYLFVAILLLTTVGIFLTFSRASILMFIVSSVIFFILIDKKKLIGGVLLVVILFGFIASPKFYDENMNLFRVKSSIARLNNYGVAINILADRPILGVGFNSYRYTKRIYNLPHNWVALPSHADAGVDNSWLFILVTTGIVGFSAYLFFWYMILRRAYQSYKKNIFSFIIIVSAGGLFFHAFFINSLFFGPIMLWMWILIAQMKEG